MNKIPLSLILAVGLMAATAAVPCGFHNYAPQPTMVDRLLSSDDIVLARSTPSNPFRFEVVEALEGSFTTPEIPFLVDSSTRRRFALDAGAAVLFARDGAYGPWVRLAYVDAAMAQVLDTVMERLPSWELEGDNDRFQYFASLMGHPDDRIQSLALRELDQADYRVLRNLDLRIDPGRIRTHLNLPTETDLKAIRILLLGLSGDIQLRTQLVNGVQYSVTSEGKYLGAYTTALIELVGPEAVTELAANYLTNREISIFARELMIEALALNRGTDNNGLDEAIFGAIHSALWVDPELAGGVARQFGAIGDWSLQAVLQASLDDGTVIDEANRQDVVRYLARALEAQP